MRQPPWRIGDDDRAERIERVQRPVRRAADVGVASWRLEVAPGLCRHPDLSALPRVERAGDSLERVRVLARGDFAVADVQQQRLEVATPAPSGSVGIARLRLARAID